MGAEAIIGGALGLYGSKKAGDQAKDANRLAQDQLSSQKSLQEQQIQFAKDAIERQEPFRQNQLAAIKGLQNLLVDAGKRRDIPQLPGIVQKQIFNPFENQQAAPPIQSQVGMPVGNVSALPGIIGNLIGGGLNIPPAQQRPQDDLDTQLAAIRQDPAIFEKFNSAVVPLREQFMQQGMNATEAQYAALQEAANQAQGIATPQGPLTPGADLRVAPRTSGIAGARTQGVPSDILTAVGGDLTNENLSTLEPSQLETLINSGVLTNNQTTNPLPGQTLQENTAGVRDVLRDRINSTIAQGNLPIEFQRQGITNPTQAQIDNLINTQFNEQITKQANLGQIAVEGEDLGIRERLAFADVGGTADQNDTAFETASTIDPLTPGEAESITTAVDPLDTGSGAGSVDVPQFSVPQRDTPSVPGIQGFQQGLDQVQQQNVEFGDLVQGQVIDPGQAGIARARTAASDPFEASIRQQQRNVGARNQFGGGQAEGAIRGLQFLQNQAGSRAATGAQADIENKVFAQQLANEQLRQQELQRQRGFTQQQGITGEALRQQQALEDRGRAIGEFQGDRGLLQQNIQDAMQSDFAQTLGQQQAVTDFIFGDDPQARQTSILMALAGLQAPGQVTGFQGTPGLAAAGQAATANLANQAAGTYSQTNDIVNMIMGLRKNNAPSASTPPIAGLTNIPGTQQQDFLNFGSALPFM